MTTRPLQAVLRSLAATPTASDEELLRRFLAGDEGAFADLVARHGRLVWAVCRNLTRSDAEADDAFQATFLVLLKRARGVRDAGKLSAWLHGVAYKVCANARLAARRRLAREQAIARPEGHGSAVPESAWDRALAAVHEEVANLPDALRVPFVLCCLEGKGQTEAAAALGWGLSTFAARLSRAKDAVVARLDARGVTLGAIAAGLVVPPPSAVARASALIHPGAVVPGSVLQLSKGVCVMASYLKVLAAGLLVAAGVGVGFGPGWTATADAQPPGPPQRQPPVEPKDMYADAKRVADLEAQVKQLQAALDAAHDQAKRAADLEAAKRADAERRARPVAEGWEALARARREGAAKGEPRPAAFGTVRWEYDLADQEAAYEKAAFLRLLQGREDAGWEFLGGTTGGPSGGKHQWLFRRPVRAAAGGPGVRLWGNLGISDGAGDLLRPPVDAGLDDLARSLLAPPTPGGVPNAATYAGSRGPTPPAAQPDDAASIEAEIDRLTARLKQVRVKPVRVDFPRDSLAFDPEDVAGLLARLADKKFGKGRLAVSASDAGVVVEGDREAVNWAAAVVKPMSGK